MDAVDYEAVAGVVIGFLLVILAVAIAIYVLTSLLMNSVHKKIYGQGTWMAWVPYVRTFLLGKLAVNKLVGIILVSASVVSEVFAGTGTSGEGSTMPLFSLISSLVGIANIVFLIMLLVKNGKLKSGELSPALAAKQCEAMDFNKVEDVPTQPKSEPVNAMPSVETNATPSSEANRFCTNCGSELPKDSAFCTNCGTKI